MQHQVASDKIRTIAESIVRCSVFRMQEQRRGLKRAQRKYEHSTSDDDLAIESETSRLGDSAAAHPEGYDLALGQNACIMALTCRDQANAACVVATFAMTHANGAARAPGNGFACVVDPVRMQSGAREHFMQTGFGIRGRRRFEERAVLSGQRVVRASHAEESFGIIVVRLQFLVRNRPGFRQRGTGRDVNATARV